MRRPLCLAMLGFTAAVRIMTWIKPLPQPSPPAEDGQTAVVAGTVSDITSYMDPENGQMVHIVYLKAADALPFQGAEMQSDLKFKDPDAELIKTDSISLNTNLNNFTAAGIRAVNFSDRDLKQNITAQKEAQKQLLKLVLRGIKICRYGKSPLRSRECRRRHWKSPLRDRECRRRHWKSPLWNRKCQCGHRAVPV